MNNLEAGAVVAAMVGMRMLRSMQCHKENGVVEVLTCI